MEFQEISCVEILSGTDKNIFRNAKIVGDGSTSTAYRDMKRSIDSTTRRSPDTEGVSKKIYGRILFGNFRHRQVKIVGHNSSVPPFGDTPAIKAGVSRPTGKYKDEARLRASLYKLYLHVISPFD